MCSFILRGKRTLEAYEYAPSITAEKKVQTEEDED